jgi:hypothetical protein
MNSISIFVLFCFVFVICIYSRRRELFSTHNSDFIADSGIFNETVEKIFSILNKVNLTPKPLSEKTFADSLGIVNKQNIGDIEKQQIILWIRNNITQKFIRFNTLYKEKDIIYTDFYLDMDDPLYYILVSAELHITPPNNINVYKIENMGLITQLAVSLVDSAPKPILYGSFIDDPEYLKETTIRNELQKFESNKKEILLRNRVNTINLNL